MAKKSFYIKIIFSGWAKVFGCWWDTLYFEFFQKQIYSNFVSFFSVKSIGWRKSAKQIRECSELQIYSNFNSNQQQRNCWYCITPEYLKASCFVYFCGGGDTVDLKEPFCFFEVCILPYIAQCVLSHFRSFCPVTLSAKLVTRCHKVWQFET
jgi:hypothetical protein